MMAALYDGDFELDGHRLNGSQDEALFIRALARNGSKDRTQDSYNPLRDTLMLGRDQKSPPLWVFDFLVGHGEHAETLENWSRLARIWEEAPRGPEDESVLRYAVAGRVRRMYGRARNFDPDPSRLFSLGRVPGAAEFQQADRLYYADDLEQVTLRLVRSSEGGGFVFPLVFPAISRPGGRRSDSVHVTGDAPTPMTITFNGPLANPAVAGEGWKAGLNTTLAYDQSVTIDSRRGTVLRNDGASLGGALTRDSYLPEVQLRPGTQNITFTGTDQTGTASCNIGWRSAYYGF